MGRGGAAVIAFLRSWLRDLRDPHVPLADVARASRKTLADGIKPPRQVFTGFVQKERRHAAPTICGKCGCPTGYNDGVTPCNTCFVEGLEAAQNAIDAANKSEKVTPLAAWRTR